MVDTASVIKLSKQIKFKFPVGFCSTILGSIYLVSLDTTIPLMKKIFVICKCVFELCIFKNDQHHVVEMQCNKSWLFDPQHLQLIIIDVFL